MTWSLVKRQCAGRGSTMVEIWMAQGQPSGNGPVTATFHGTPSNAVIAVSRYSNVDQINPIDNMVSGNTIEEDGPCTGGTDGVSYSYNLHASVNGAVVYGAVAMRSRTHTEGAGFTERGEIKFGASPPVMASVAVQDRNIMSPATIAVRGSFNADVDWAMAAVEIRPASTAKANENDQTAENSQPVTDFALAQNYPNPFNPGTMINFSLPQAGKVTLRIFNETGQLVQTLVDRQMAAGRHSLRWNARNQAGNPVAAGVYLYQIIAQGQNGKPLFSQTRRMILLK
jgi:hypothetical protein